MRVTRREMTIGLRDGRIGVVVRRIKDFNLLKAKIVEFLLHIFKS